MEVRGEGQCDVVINFYSVNLKGRRIALNNLENRRDQLRVPLNLKFRLRERFCNFSHVAESFDINSHGIQVTTEAQLQPGMCVEIWPEDEGRMNLKDYAEGSYYVHGDVVWAQRNKRTHQKAFGIAFNRKIDWAIPMGELTEKMSHPQLEGAPPQFVLDAMVDGVFSVDAEWRISTFNRAAEELTGWTRGEAIGRHCYEVFQANNCGEGCVLAESLNKKEPVDNCSVFITHASGKRIWATVSATPLINKAGELVGGVQVFRKAKSFMGSAVLLEHDDDEVSSADTNWRYLFE